MDGNLKKNVDKFFSAGLGKGGRAASWIIAIGIVGGVAYYDKQLNRDNGRVFTKVEQTEWNKTKAAATATTQLDPLPTTEPKQE